MAWFEIRDMFLGDNYTKQDIPKALVLARSCPHPDAQWLSKTFEFHVPADSHEAEIILGTSLSRGDNDVRTLCFFGYINNLEFSEEIQTASDRGYAFAQTIIAARWADNEQELAQLAADQGERDGYYLLGFYKEAMDMRSYSAMEEHAYNLLEEGDAIAAWKLWCKCFSVGCRTAFNIQLSGIITAPFTDFNRPLLYLCGQAVYLYRKKTVRIPQSKPTPDNQERVVLFYIHQIKSYRKAVDAFSMCCLRMSIYKDLRILIGTYIWNCREEAEYRNCEN